MKGNNYSFTLLKFPYLDQCYNFENKADNLLKFEFVLTNSADHGEMPHRAAFHLLVFTVCQNNLLAVYGHHINSGLKSGILFVFLFESIFL